MSVVSTSIVDFLLHQEKMRQAGLADWQIERFRLDFESLQSGAGGYLAESELTPLRALPRLLDLAPADWTESLTHTVVIKLNGGLGTSMGLEIPKGLLPVREGQSFLDLTRLQVENLRALSASGLPLLLMNSFHTRGPSLERLAGFSNGALPLDFLQSKVPKIRQDNLQPVEFPEHPELEWCPPGHGEIYAALRGGGMLQRLLDAGYRYAFVSNIDNLGATLEPALLQWFSQSGLDFAMEVTERTQQDKKGGHLASPRGGGLCLRERSQCAPGDLNDFENIEKHRYFNTNNLWVRLQALEQQPLPRLPLIINRKPVDPTHPDSTPIFQLESAMGAAIACFERTQAIEVPRTRFLPVKTLADLLLLRSDLYRLDQDGHLLTINSRPLPQVKLDSRYYGTYQDFEVRFAAVPGLEKCDALELEGDIRFGPGVRLEGTVKLSNAGPEPLLLP
ncbi:MAG: UTP--glucose-1-phosphate uridylyltransferase [Vulcanimicrobiota bacterium]